MPQATPAEMVINVAGFSCPVVRGKKVTDAFDGGRPTSDGGVLVLAHAVRMMEVCGQLTASIPDQPDPARVVHRLEVTFVARVLAIACGYEDADDFNALRDDLGFRLALGKLPGSGPALPAN